MTIGNKTGSPIGGFSAVKTQNQLDNWFIQGKAYSYKALHTIAANTTVNMVFDMTTTPATNITLVMQPITYQATGGPVIIKYYANTITDNDTGPETSIPRRGGFPPAMMRMRKNPTISNIGTFISDDLVHAISGGQGAGASNTGGYPFELRLGVDYAVTWLNDSNSSILFLNKFNWSEGPVLYPQP